MQLSVRGGFQANFDKTTRELEAMTQRAQKLRHDYEIQLMTADQLAQENQHKVTELKVSHVYNDVRTIHYTSVPLTDKCVKCLSVIS